MKIRENAEQGDVQARMMFEQMQDRPEFKDHFEKMKPEFFEKDFEGTKKDLKRGDERNRDPNDRRGPPPGFEQDRNREGQPGGRTEGEPPNGRATTRIFLEVQRIHGSVRESKMNQGHFKKMPKIIDRNQQINQEANEQNTQKFLNRKIK